MFFGVLRGSAKQKNPQLVHLLSSAHGFASKSVWSWRCIMVLQSWIWESRHEDGVFLGAWFMKNPHYSSLVSPKCPVCDIFARSWISRQMACKHWIARRNFKYIEHGAFGSGICCHFIHRNVDTDNLLRQKTWAVMGCDLPIAYRIMKSVKFPVSVNSTHIAGILLVGIYYRCITGI